MNTDPEARRRGYLRRRNLGAALAASLAFHALLLLLEFRAADPTASSADAAALHVQLLPPAPAPAAETPPLAPAFRSTLTAAAAPPQARHKQAALPQSPRKKTAVPAPQILVAATPTENSLPVPPPAPPELSATPAEITTTEKPVDTPQEKPDAMAADTLLAFEAARQAEEKQRINEEQVRQQEALKLRAEEAARQAQQQRLATLAAERQRIEEEQRQAQLREQQRLAQERLDAQRQAAAAAAAAEQARQNEIARLNAAAEAGKALALASKPGPASGENKSASAAASPTSTTSSARPWTWAALPGTPPPAPPAPSRRGSLRGNDARDIQIAFYGDGWRQKIERIGAVNAPALSKYPNFRQPLVSVSIRSDGSLAAVRIERSSGYQELDQAVQRIVEMSAPFAPFQPALKSNYDIIDITREWNFVGAR